MKFEPTVRSTFVSDDPNLIITYFNPSITAFDDNKELKSQKDIMYFYYNIEIYYKNKLLLEAYTHDFPKVQNLHSVIDYLLSEDDYVLEDARGGTYYTYYIKNKKQYYHGDHFEREYSYHFDAIKTRFLKDDKHVSEYEYTLTIDNKQVLNKYKSENEKVTTPVRIVLNKDELIRLKGIAESFMENAINHYNKYELPELIEFRKNYKD